MGKPNNPLPSLLRRSSFQPSSRRDYGGSRLGCEGWTTPQAWLEEIARAYQGALEAIPFGPLVGHPSLLDLLYLVPPQRIG